MSQRDPNSVIIKRWVPEHEQAMLWDHTRRLRISMGHRHDGGPVMLEVGGHRHGHRRGSHSGDYEFVRKRSRSKSPAPGLLMYLAGGRPR